MSDSRLNNAPPELLRARYRRLRAETRHIESRLNLLRSQPSVDSAWEIKQAIARLARRWGIALIKSMSGRVVGRCEVVGCVGPLTLADLKQNQPKRRISSEQWDLLPYRKTYAWVLQHAMPIDPPIPYKHPPGAVIWVKLIEQYVPKVTRLERALGCTHSR